MKLSWSQNLFLKINKQVGKSPLLDKVMYFCAHWLVWFLFGIFFIWLMPMWFDVATKTKVVKVISLFLISAVCSYIISYLIALIWKNGRPIIEFPEIKTLVNPLGNWKSFPSDHTIAVTLLVFTAWYISAPLLFFIFLIIGALAVMFGRVYAGVHYPRDIVGGIILGFLTSCGVWYFLI